MTDKRDIEAVLAPFGIYADTLKERAEKMLDKRYVRDYLEALTALLECADGKADIDEAAKAFLAANPEYAWDIDLPCSPVLKHPNTAPKKIVERSVFEALAYEKHIAYRRRSLILTQKLLEAEEDASEFVSMEQEIEIIVREMDRFFPDSGFGDAYRQGVPIEDLLA